ncbi:recombinase family protein [Hyphobacterium indicum]|uniref:recombinase family protein n=1 Tax=Hyphobacterium indicum TaxID=2162714 RepID=UPI000D64B6A5|nr:recombinase family protein [Hyphobacterium indicum]
MNEKAVIYCRVSDTKQKLEGHGLESQEVRCIDYAERCGYEVAKVFKDDASGGIADRPRFVEMLAFLEARKAESHIVIVDDINRISRSLEVHLMFREKLKAIGARFESPTQKFGEGADDRMVEMMLVNVAEYQRLKNAEQTKNRMWGRLKNGYWVFQAPRGYKFEKVGAHGKLLVKNEPVASILTEALEGFASGRFQTMAEVKRFLETFPEYPRDTKKGEVRIQRIRPLLTQSLFAGYVEHEGWGIKMTKGHHDPLISMETFQKIQDRLNGKPAKVPATLNLNEMMPLRGFVRCRSCGGPLTGGRSKGRNKYYFYYECQARGCSERRKSIPKNRIEGDFEALLASMQPRKELFHLLHAMLRDLWDAQAERGAAMVSAVKKELAEIERDIERLVDRTLDTTSSTLAKRYEQRLSDLEARKLVLIEQQSQIGRPQSTFERTSRTAMRFLANPLNLWNSKRIEDKRAVLKLTFSDQISYDRKQGYRTANLSLPFKVLGRINGEKREMVPAEGLEPPTP